MDILVFLLGVIFLIFLPLGQLFRIPIGTFTVTGLDVFVCLTTAIWVFIRFRKRQEMPTLFFPIVFFISVGIISLLVNLTWLRGIDLLVSFLYLLRWFGYAALIWVGQDIAKKSKIIISRLLLVGGGMVMIFGIFQYIFFPSLHNYLYLGWDDHFYRVFSTFLDPNFVGAFLVLYLFFVFRQILESTKNIRIYLIFINCLTIIAVFLTYSRSAYLMLTIGTLYFFWSLGYRKMLIFTILTVSTVVIFLGIFRHYGEGNNLLRTSSIDSRLGSMNTALSIFRKNPVFGVGFNSYRYAQRKYGFLQGNLWETTHAGAGSSNSYLFILATTGVIGLGAFAFLLFKIFQRIGFLEKKEKLMAIMLKASIISLLINSLFENTLFYPSIMLWIFILIGVMG